MTDWIVKLYRKMNTTARRAAVLCLAFIIALSTMHIMTFPATALTRKAGENDPGIVIGDETNTEGFDNASEGENTEVNPVNTEAAPAEEPVVITDGETPAPEDPAAVEPTPDSTEPAEPPVTPDGNEEAEVIVEPTATPEPTETPVAEEEPEEESDPSADVETAADWEDMFRDVELTGVWADDLLTLAELQKGYKESEKNFVKDDEGKKYGYTRYGEWYGDPYAEWDSLFVMFNLYYAGITKLDFPYQADCEEWIDALKEAEMFHEVNTYVPNKGDLVFADVDEDNESDHVAIVKAVEKDEAGNPDKLIVIEGNIDNEVKESTYEFYNPLITGFAQLPENPLPVQEEAIAEEPEAEPVYATFEGKANNVVVTVQYEEGAFPEGTTMKVKPVWNPSVLGAINDTVTDKEVVKVQAVDIIFLNAEGKEIEPSKPIKVTMKSTSIPKQAEETPVVVHVDDKLDTSVVEAEQAEEAEKPTEAVTFESDAFSVYAIVYTVDFAYALDGHVYTFNMEGGTSMKLSALVEALGIIEETSLENGKAFVAEVQKVEFTDPSLLKVRKDFFGNDWTLTSLQPFTSEEALTITMKNGDVLTLRVTDEQTSSDLSAFLTKVTVSGAELDNGNYKVEKGKTYGVTMTFKETANLQFANTSELTYKLPTGITLPSETDTNITIAIVSSGRTYEVPAHVSVDQSGNVKVKFDETSPNFSKLASATNVSFRVSVDAMFDENINKSEWGSKMDKDIVIDTSDHSDAFAEKSGVFDEATGKFTYTIKVRAQGNPKNVHVKDLITGNALIFNNDVQVTGNSSSYTSTPLPDGQKGFDYTFASMQNGEEITITYSASLDPAKAAGADVITADMTKNTVTVQKDGGDPHNAEYSHEINLKKPDKSDGMEAGVTEDGDKLYNWTVEYNKTALVPVGGDKVSDKIKDSAQEYMKYYGPVTVKVYDHSGTLVDTRSFTPGSDSAWTYTIPSEDKTPYRYVFEYQTVVDQAKVDGSGKPMQLQNDSTGPGGSDDGKIDVGPKELTSIDKHVESSNPQEVTWVSHIHVPEDGLATAVVTDTLPNMYSGNIGLDGNYTLYDFYKEGTLDIQGRLPGESYSVDTSNTGKVVITFYKDSGKTQPGLRGTTGGHDITVRLTTLVDQKWLQYGYEHPGDYRADHTNKININGGKDEEDTATFSAPDLKKSGQKEGNYYLYTLVLSGVTEEPLIIDDVFDTDKLQVAESMASDYRHFTIWGGNQYSQGDGATSVNYSDTSTGLQITADSLPRQSNGEFYSYYKIQYFLELKDGVDLNALAIENGGKYELKNTADWNGHKGSFSFETKYDFLNKELLKEATATDRHVQYKITFNPAKAELNGGQTIPMTDTLNEHLSVDYTSIHIKTDPEGVEVPYSLKGDGDDEDVGGTIATYMIPDSTKVEITYDAMVVGDGTINYKNTVEAHGEKEIVDKTTNIHIEGEGDGANAYFKVLKVDGYNANKKLAGVKFRLYAGDGRSLSLNESEDVKELILETDENGLLLIDGTKIKIFLDKTVTYYLEEVEAKDGYQIISFPYRFTLVDNIEDVDYEHYVYFYNDSMQIKNWPLEGLVVGKNVDSDEAADHTKDFKFNVSILKDDDTVDESVNQKYGDMEFVNGVATLELRDREQKSAWDMPKGTRFKVEELDCNGYVVSATIDEAQAPIQDGTTENGKAVIGTTGENYTVVTFTNTKPHEQVEISVKKEWEPEPQDDASVTLELRRYAKITEGTIELTLNDQFGNPVPGAVFQLYKDDNPQESSYTTDSFGKIVVTGLEKGSYYLRETTIPNGYSLPEGVTYVQTEPLTVDDVTTEQKLNATLLNEKLKTTGSVLITLTRTDTNTPVEGAGFTLSKEDGTGQVSASTNEYGQITFDELSAGTYVVKQTSTASDLKLAPDQTFTITSTEDLTLSFVNNLKPVYYTLTFRSSGDNLSKEYKFEKDTQVTFTFDNGNQYYNPYDNHELSGDVTGTIGPEPGSRTFSVLMDSDKTVTISDTSNQNWGNIVEQSLQLSPEPAVDTEAATAAFTRRSLRAAAPRLAAAANSTHVDAEPPAAPEGYAEDTKFNAISVTLENGTWSYTFPKQDKTDPNGNPYYYYVVETNHSPDSYWVDSYVDGPLNESGTLQVINKKEEKGKIIVNKIWDGVTNEEDLAALKAGFLLKVEGVDAGGPGVHVARFTFDQLPATIKNLPLNQTYTITESNSSEVVGKYTVVSAETVDHFDQATPSVDGTTYKLKNTYTYETTEATVKKVWSRDDPNDRPESLTVTLVKNGEATEDTVTLNAANDWTGTITNLPKMEKGAEIEYSWLESNMPEGYYLTSVAKEGTITTLTNTKSEYDLKTSYVGIKSWSDQDNKYDTRPTNLVVKLYADTQTEPLELDPIWEKDKDSGQWTYTFENLPVFNENGKIIHYHAKETVPAGYEKTKEENTPTEGVFGTIDYVDGRTRITEDDLIVWNLGSLIDLSFVAIKPTASGDVVVWTHRVPVPDEVTAIKNAIRSGALPGCQNRNIVFYHGTGDVVTPHGKVTVTYNPENMQVVLDFGGPSTWTQFIVGQFNKNSSSKYTPGTTSFENTLLTTELSGTKIWDLAGDAPTEMPVLTLTRTVDKTGEDGGTITSDPETVQVDQDGEKVNLQPAWTGEGKNHSFSYLNLPKYNKEGLEYHYSVSEFSFKVDSVTYSVQKDDDGNYIAVTTEEGAREFKVTQEGNAITNKEVTDFEFSKIWKDSSGVAEEWPDGKTITVTFNAYSDSTTKTPVLEPQTLTFDNDKTLPNSWEKSVKNNVTTFKTTGLPKTKDGKELTYYVIEEKVDGYKAPIYKTSDGIRVEGRAEDGQQIINTPEDAVILPKTGGSGTGKVTILGSIFILLGAGVLLLRRRKESL